MGYLAISNGIIQALIGTREEYVIAEYDGVEYQNPVSWINMEDVGITPQYSFSVKTGEMCSQ